MQLHDEFWGYGRESVGLVCFCFCFCSLIGHWNYNPLSPNKLKNISLLFLFLFVSSSYFNLKQNVLCYIKSARKSGVNKALASFQLLSFIFLICFVFSLQTLIYFLNHFYILWKFPQSLKLFWYLRLVSCVLSRVVSVLQITKRL